MSINYELRNGQHVQRGPIAELKQGVKAITTKMLISYDESFFMAFIKVEQWLNSTVIPTIALGKYPPGSENAGTSGTLRVGWFNSWELNKSFSLADAVKSWWQMKFNTQKLLSNVFKKGGEAYGIFHMKEIRGTSVYFKPSTEGTKPVDMTVIWNTAINMLVDELILQLRWRGWNFGAKKQ